MGAEEATGEDNRGDNKEGQGIIKVPVDMEEITNITQTAGDMARDLPRVDGVDITSLLKGTTPREGMGGMGMGTKGEGMATAMVARPLPTAGITPQEGMAHLPKVVQGDTGDPSSNMAAHPLTNNNPLTSLPTLPHNNHHHQHSQTNPTRNLHKPLLPMTPRPGKASRLQPVDPWTLAWPLGQPNIISIMARLPLLI